MYRTRFIDSLNYFHMKLSALPKAFGLSETLRKGYFPHLFTSKETMSYVGIFPAPEYYGLDSMSTSERSEFSEWYSRQHDQIFNMRSELVKYTISDVEILRLSCMKFHEIMKDFGNTDPFLEGVPSPLHAIDYTGKSFSKKNTIGIVPTQGYRRGDRHSQDAVSWFLYHEREDGRVQVTQRH